MPIILRSNISFVLFYQEKSSFYLLLFIINLDDFLGAYMKVVIVGAGISGLSTAFFINHFAEKAGKQISCHIFEALERAGGKMATEHCGGFVIEEGPNGFLDNKPYALELTHLIHGEEFLLPASTHAKKRFICHKGRLLKIPESPISFLFSPILSISGKIQVIKEFWVKPLSDSTDETVEAFARRRLGEEAEKLLIDPMVSGVFAGDPNKLSIQAAFPRIKEIEKEYGSLIRGMINIMKQARKSGKKFSASASPQGRLTSFKGGVSTLIGLLTKHMSGSIQLGAKVEKVYRSGHIWRVTYSIGDEIKEVDTDVVVLSCPSFEASEILAHEASSLSLYLNQIPYAPIAVVATGFSLSDCPIPLDGFGFLVPSIEQRPILGVLWDSSVFYDRAPLGHCLLRTMIGGARHPELVEKSDLEMIDLVMNQLRELMRIKASPKIVRVYRHKKGIPQYEVGHLRKIEQIDKEVSRLHGLFLCNNAYKGIALNDCVREAKTQALAICKYLGLEVLE